MDRTNTRFLFVVRLILDQNILLFSVQQLRSSESSLTYKLIYSPFRSLIRYTSTVEHVQYEVDEKLSPQEHTIIYTFTFADQRLRPVHSVQSGVNYLCRRRCGEFRPT